MTLQLWRCGRDGSGHILGFITERGCYQRLYLFRAAFDEEPGAEDYAVATEVCSGHVIHACSICGRRRHWSAEVARELGTTAVLKMGEAPA
jgi:hypothetical protein